jgi:hypothetical protein
MQLDDLLSNAILYVFIPLWLLAGFADWLCHRVAHISETAGVKESLLHLLMLAEAGLPLLAALFLEINALIFGIMVLGFLVHEATVLWDLRYASSKRRILPVEQMVHSFQELIPLTILSLLAFSYWDQFAALATLAPDADFGLQWKREKLPAAYLIVVLLGAVVLVVLPFIEELWRCCRAAPGSRRGGAGLLKKY